MKTIKNWIVIPTALAILLSSVGVARTQTAIAPGFQPDPLVLTGSSGGSKASKGCGMIKATPNHIITLGDSFKYLRFSLQSAGQPTLLIEGPNGSSCVQADSFSGGAIQAPGYWEKGNYSIYIGDRTGSQHPYTLSITQKRG
jgi:hypothetical protein